MNDGMLLRHIPSTHTLIEYLRSADWIRSRNIPDMVLKKEIQSFLEELRERLRRQEPIDLSMEKLEEELRIRIDQKNIPHLRAVINATGILLHTNLGRATLSKRAIDHVAAISSRYSNLEYSLHSGNRGSRHEHVEYLVKELTGAEAAMVVNNNAAAVFLVLKELAANKEVVISRGELVEIGGSFRIPEIMKEAGAILKEVGTTNKTHLDDYEKAISPQTALLLKVHASNFRMVGFTQSVSLADLAALGKKYQIPVYQDLGSGVLYDLRKHGIGNEPLVQEVISQGADLVSFSGDKLLGGPQAGIVAGKKVWIDRLKKNQLARILRVDKMTLAALESTLQLYFNENELLRELPVLREICTPVEEIRQKAVRLYNMIHARYLVVSMRKDETEVGGGALPDVRLPTYVLAVRSDDNPSHILERKLRKNQPAIIARIKNSELILDLRTIMDDELETVAKAINDLENGC